MPISTTGFTPNKLAQIAWTQLKESGVNITADAVDMLETYINEGYDIMESWAGYNPEAYAVSMARMAVRWYAMWQYLSIGPKNAEAAANAMRNWEVKLREWSEDAAKAYHYEQAQAG